tara:strand:+ start:1110 stop:1220 length:111 start_codon:yes stop_codon:yes gene_type:complete
MLGELGVFKAVIVKSILARRLLTALLICPSTCFRVP